MARRLRELYANDSQETYYEVVSWNYDRVLGIVSLWGIGIFEMSTPTHFSYFNSAGTIQGFVSELRCASRHCSICNHEGSFLKSLAFLHDPRGQDLRLPFGLP